MKKMIAAAALLAVSSAFAQEELKFGDLNYFLKSGEKQLSAAIDLRSDRATTGGSKIEQEGYFIDTLFTYALSDRLNLFVGLNYQWEVEVEDKSAPANARYNQDGLQNPVLGGAFRLWNQNEAAVNFDLGVLGRVRIEDAETGDTAVGTTDEDGNAADGRHSLEAFARIGKKWNEANEWQLQAGVVHHFDGEHDELVAGGASTELEDDASTDIYVRAAYQYRPVNEFMMAFALQATQVAEATSEIKSTGTEIEDDAHLDWDFSFTAKYLVTSNLIARFNFGIGHLPDFDQDTAGTKVEIEKRKHQRLGLGVDWLF